MSFLQKLFAKKQTEPAARKEKKTPEDEVNVLVEEIYEALRAVSEQEIVQLTVKKGEAHLFDSKIGGPYYVPEGMEIPVDKNTDNPMFLLAQLNFTQLPMKEPFPDSGLLQIFISGDDDIYEMCIRDRL